jgi:hypothetical protein
MSESTNHGSFRIISTGSNFDIRAEKSKVKLPGTDREVLFATQKNSYDCGPCLTLNILSVLGLPTQDLSIVDIRKKTNKRDHDWFFTNDVSHALEERGIKVEPYSVKSPQQEIDFINSLQEKIEEKTPFVVYSGVNRHFKGIYCDGQNYYSIDSLHKTINSVSQGEIATLIEQVKASDRVEALTIAYKHSVK